MNLKQTQNIIADDSFRYGGDSLDIIDIVNAIKAGYRLCKIEDAISEIQETREKDFFCKYPYSRCVEIIRRHEA